MTPPEAASTTPVKEFLRRNAATAVALFLAVVTMRYFVRAVTDDAFITYRYALNLLSGNGFVFNPGERVLATTTPLYALLVAGWMALGVPPWLGSLVLEAAVLTGGLTLLAAWLEEEFGPASRWALVLFCLHNPLHIVTMAGMESTLFGVGVMAALYAATHGWTKTAVMLAFAAPFVRPEGLLLIGLVGAVLARDRWREGKALPWATVAAVAVAFALAVAALWAYFGSPLPHSVVAKRAQGVLRPWSETFAWIYLREQFLPFGYHWSAWGLLQAIGFVRMATKPTLRWLAFWYAVYLAFMIVGRAPHYNWYADCLLPARVAGLVAGASWLVGLVPTGRFTALRKPMVAAAATLLLVVAAAPGFERVYLILLQRAVTTSEPAVACKLYEKAGPWLREHAAPEDEIFSPEIGYVGYFSERQIYDPVGIASPEALADYGHLSLWEQAIKRGSRWVVVSQRHSEWKVAAEFEQAYRPAQTWEDAQFRCIVFERVEGARRAPEPQAAPGS